MRALPFTKALLALLKPSAIASATDRHTLGDLRLLILMAALATAALSACGDDTSAPPPADMSIVDMSVSAPDCGLCGHPPDLKSGD